jgi:two-component system, OmpR family, sensor kinase
MVLRPWPKGLQRRVALGLAALLSVMVIVQAIVLLWTYRAFSHGTSDELHERALTWTRAISRDLSNQLEVSGSTDIHERLRQLDVTQRVFVIFRDGRVVGAAPQSLIKTVVKDLQMSEVPPSWADTPYAAAPLLRGGQVVGVVGLAPRSKLERLGPLVGAIFIAFLVIAIGLFSIVVVAPMRARLLNLQMAAKRLGSGDLTARTDPVGADEISELAGTFNVMADELERRTNALETSDRLRRQLVADVSHELKTPLTAVMGRLETLDMEDLRLSDDERRKQVAIALREARRLHRLINDLLLTARYEAHAITMQVEDVSVRALFEAIRLRAELECAARGITFTTEISAEAEHCRADPFRIEQALENVVANALRHTPNHGRISMEARLSGKALIIEVGDSGEGIAPEHLPYVFDRFYKASSAHKIASPGAGLGLSIVKAIVEAHSGRVHASSVQGMGTIISIEIPVDDSKPAVESPGQAGALQHPITSSA